MLNNNDAARAEPLMGDDLSASKEAATTVDVDAVAEPQKSDSPFRWVVLFFSCLALMGNYYCFDNPGAMKTALDEYVGLSEVQYSLLYTIYSLPNVILPFFGGYLCDVLGASRAFALFAATLVAGQIVFAFGTSVKSIGFMYLGRFIYGLGGENMSVGASVILADWFAGKEMAFAMAVNVSVSRCGSIINNVLSPAIADSTNVPTALWVGAIVCGTSFGCTLMLYPIDIAGALTVKKAKAALKSEAKASAAAASPMRSGSTSRARSRSASEEEEVVVPFDSNPLKGCADVKEFTASFWLLTLCCVVVYACVIPFNDVASSLLLERDYFKPQTNHNCALVDPSQCQSNSNPPDSNCQTGDAWKPPLPDFIHVDDIVCTDSSWDVSSGPQCAHEYCKDEKEGVKQAAYLLSIPYALSACLSPFLGGVIDVAGGRAFVCLASGLMLVLVHALLGYSSVTPYVPLVGQGVAYSMFAAALWPSVPYLVPEKSVGIAYGVVTSVQNIGLAGIPLLASVVYSASGERYIPNVEGLFVIFAICGSLSALVLNFLAPQLNMKHPTQCLAVEATVDAKPSARADFTASSYAVLQDDA